MTLITASGAQAAGVIIALDRQERGQSEQSAIQEVEQRYGIPVISIVRLDDMVAYLADKPAFREALAAIEVYQDRYSVNAHSAQ